MNKLKEMAAKSAIESMLKGDHFSICVIDKVARMYGGNAGGEAYDLLSTLHCVNFQDIDKELRFEIPSLIALALQFEQIPSSIKSSTNVIEMRRLM